ncbi:MAG TPA: hypothetical protein VMW27_25500, partial [Thermoanaerobaculia bacterium]|nr:hypothetical protein [Thermoanaerobaculia bacterium]
MARKDAFARQDAAPPGSLADFVAELAADPKLGEQLVHVEHLPGVEVSWGELDPPLPSSIAQALAKNGVRRLFSHQAEGIAAIRRGENLLVTTP